VYAGGSFTTVGGTTRNYLAAVDATSGAATSWDPNVHGGPIHALAVDGATVYAGGAFDAVGGMEHLNMAAIDAATGAPASWLANPDGPVRAISVSGSTVYAGGDFITVSAQERSRLAAMDAITGALLAWQPDVRGGVEALAVDPDVVHVGGSFASVDGEPQAHLAVFPAAVVSVPPGVALSADFPSIMPTPARDQATVSFTLATEAKVTLAVYDTQGRRMASLLDRASLPAGVHQVPVSTIGWRAGAYFCRLDAGDTRWTRKLLVIP
jgi:hypothetical protein